MILKKKTIQIKKLVSILIIEFSKCVTVPQTYSTVQRKFSFCHYIIRVFWQKKNIIQRFHGNYCYVNRQVQQCLKSMTEYFTGEILYSQNPFSSRGIRFNLFHPHSIAAILLPEMNIFIGTVAITVVNITLYIYFFRHFELYIIEISRSCCLSNRYLKYNLKHKP